MHEHEPVDVYISGNAGDPREAAVSSVSRTLIDLAEVISEDELRQVFRTAIAKGLVDLLSSDRRLDAYGVDVLW